MEESLIAEKTAEIERLQQLMNETIILIEAKQFILKKEIDTLKNVQEIHTTSEAQGAETRIKYAEASIPKTGYTWVVERNNRQRTYEDIRRYNI